MKNKFGGNCGRCGKSVAPGVGQVFRDSNGRWITWHNDCRAEPRVNKKSNKSVASV